MPEPCQEAAKVKGLLGGNKPSNPAQGPCAAFDVQYLGERIENGALRTQRVFTRC